VLASGIPPLTAVLDIITECSLLNINAQRVADLRRRVEELISLPEYYEVEAATTEKGSTTTV
jgi:hypothetical protein